MLTEFSILADFWCSTDHTADDGNCFMCKHWHLYC